MGRLVRHWASSCDGAGGDAGMRGGWRRGATPALPTYSTGRRVARASEWPHRPGGRPIREANGVELQGMADLVYRCVIAASRAVFRGLGLRIELRGEEHLPTTGGAVLASNHLSFLDFTFLELVGVERGRPVRFLCKERVRSAGGRLGDAPDGPPRVDRGPRRPGTSTDGCGVPEGPPEGPIRGPRCPDELWLNSAARPGLWSFHGPRLGLMTTATLVLVLVVVVPRSRSTSRTASTTPATRWPRPSPPVPCDRRSQSASQRC